MRPRTFAEFEGQQALVGEGTVLRRALEAGRLPSLVLWGPPGCGKTALARLIARQLGAQVIELSAVSAGVADLRAVIDEARHRRRHGQRTLLFIDEIHRFSKSQQDAILPAVESGLITLVGATTENPAFEVNAALLSRCRVFRLEPLEEAALERILERALTDPERGLGRERVALAPAARRFLLQQAAGDARIALTALELAVAATPPSEDGIRRVELAAVEGALQHRALRFDKAGDQHYDLISALIKSVRASDPDAAIYWLARLLEAGEDPLFVARRLVILAAEDVGLADPQALVVAVAAQQAVHFVGMPEGYLPLAEATLYLAAAPKSNSALRAYQAARAEVLATLDQPVPLHLRNAPTGLAKAFGHGAGYRYAHEAAAPNPADPARPPDALLQPNLPAALQGRQFYQPTAIGAEASIRRWLERRRAAAPEEGPPP
ncbi:MAG: replication-associated recombination protein A [Chloroflexi bacterium]|nr:replication-associated recombination protein A [Chloroflexota bacterium]